MIQAVLRNHKILVCRPEPGASELAAALTSVGAEVEILPCLEIHPLELDNHSKQKLMELDRYRHVIVVSQHAARIGIDRIDDFWPQMPVKQTWHAIGRQTAKQLPVETLDISLPNADLTTEQLLDQDAFKRIKGERVLILKGKKGRTILEQQLSKRGAKVDTLELYERVQPDYDSRKLTQQLIEFDPDFFIALSAETLENLISYFDQIGFRGEKKAFVLSSDRVANIALEQGFHLTYVPDNLKPIDIIRCLAKIKRCA